MSMAAAIGILRAAYPRQSFPDESVRLYARMLSDMDDGEVTDAIHALIQTRPFLPSISEIRGEVAEKRLALPTAAAAWDMVWWPPNGRPRIVTEAVRQCGGRWALAHGDSHQAERRFVKVYEQIRAEAIRDVVAGGRITVPKPPLAASLLALPESEQAVPRPLMKRLVRRHSGLPVGSPTDVERHDAIELLAVTDDPDDPLQQEAEDVLWRSRRDDR